MKNGMNRSDSSRFIFSSYTIRSNAIRSQFSYLLVTIKLLQMFGYVSIMNRADRIYNRNK